MDIAALNVKIMFQKNETVVDTIGNHQNQWSDFYSCYATLSDSEGKSSAETAVAGQLLDQSDISFTVRFCKRTLAVTSTGYRILWNGDIYNILKIDHLNFKKRALKFRCEKVRR